MILVVKITPRRNDFSKIFNKLTLYGLYLARLPRDSIFMIELMINKEPCVCGGI